MFPLDTFPTAEEIALRAHALFLAGGRRSSKASGYWRQAEQELLDLGARRTLGRLAEQRATSRPRRRADRPLSEL
jgi:Protein of unknown function (DUF2934)